jgi:hypothetical protein
VRERAAGKNVVMQQMEYDDMAKDQYQDKSPTTGHGPPQDRQPPSQPQIPSPLLSEGPELLRDSHC